MGVEAEWIHVPGGALPAGRWRAAVDVGDLKWARTPLTHAVAARLLAAADQDRLEDHEPGLVGAGWCAWCAELPVTGLSFEQARVAAEAVGGRLPTSAEWEWMAGGGTRTYPWGEDHPGPAHANLRGTGPDAPTPVGQFPAGATPAGILDVAGNVWEWTSSPVPGNGPGGLVRGVVVRGGSYRALALYAQCGYANEVPVALASPGIGVRAVRT